MQRTRLTAWTLTLAGLLPFLAGAALIIFNPRDGTRWIEPLAAYGAIILSFLAGTRWGRGLAERDPRPATLIFSNLPPVAAWLTFLPGVPDRLQFLVLMTGLGAMLFWDLRGSDAWYRRLRWVASVGAVASLGAVALMS